MIGRIRIIPHEAVPLCGSYEVRFPDGRPSRYFYWDDNRAAVAPRPGPQCDREAGRQIVC
jgi:hypothetical protein